MDCPDHNLGLLCMMCMACLMCMHMIDMCMLLSKFALSYTLQQCEVMCVNR